MTSTVEKNGVGDGSIAGLVRPRARWMPRALPAHRTAPLHIGSLPPFGSPASRLSHCAPKPEPTTRPGLLHIRSSWTPWQVLITILFQPNQSKE